MLDKNNLGIDNNNQHSLPALNALNRPLQIRQHPPLQNLIVQHNRTNISATYSHPNRIIQSPTVLSNSRTVPNAYTAANINQKMPERVRQSIIKFTYSMRPISKIQTEEIRKSGQLGSLFKCDICLIEYSLSQKVQFAKCGHAFCDSCLRHYADYKISHFEKVLCPTGECPESIDSNSLFFQSLSPELQAKSKKKQVFDMVMQNPHLRMCPNEKCNDGVMDLSTGASPVCNMCGNIYCEKCFYPQHSGTCDQTELEFFQNNFMFRQCTRCKNVIQKAQGCNHITCRCGYQFCYLCGGRWRNNNHICGQPDAPLNLRDDLPPARNRHQAIQRALLFHQQANRRPLTTRICTILFKILIILPLTLIGITLYLALRILGLLIILITIILKGLFYTSCKIIQKSKQPWNFIFALFFPVIMLWGVWKALYSESFLFYQIMDIGLSVKSVFLNCFTNQQF